MSELVTGPVAGTCKFANEPSGPIRSGKFLGKLSDYRVFKRLWRYK
jgi:hypothetical protein